ncbi:MAG: cell division FtsA domain-containing protein [Candidatus Gribaldobacteria bacterium]|nr:cell division FtsA domain-containing protein [Candidatus Gribaldobacteria bacterium]
MCLRTEISTAEAIKKKYGTLKSEAIKKILKTKQKTKQVSKNLEAMLAEEEPQEKDFFPEFSTKLLRDIVEERFTQLFNEVQKSLKRINTEPLPAGVFFTGGGSAMPGLVELAKQKLKLPCRLGHLHNIIGCDDPKFATCLGLLLMGFDDLQEDKDLPEGGDFKDKLKRFLRIFLP